MLPPNPFRTYFQTLHRHPGLGNATEHTLRLALKQVPETLDSTIDAVNEPQRLPCEAPNFVVSTRGAE